MARGRIAFVSPLAVVNGHDSYLMHSFLGSEESTPKRHLDLMCSTQTHIHTDHAAAVARGLSVCVSVCVGHTGELCKNGWTDRHAVGGGADSRGFVEPRIRWGPDPQREWALFGGHFPKPGENKRRYTIASLPRPKISAYFHRGHPNGSPK